MEDIFKEFLRDWEENSTDALVMHFNNIPIILNNFSKSNKSYYKGVGFYSPTKLVGDELLKYIKDSLAECNLLTSVTKELAVAQLFSESFSTYQGYCAIHVVLEVKGELEYDFTANIKEKEVIIYKPKITKIISYKYDEEMPKGNLPLDTLKVFD